MKKVIVITGAFGPWDIRRVTQALSRMSRNDEAAGSCRSARATLHRHPKRQYAFAAAVSTRSTARLQELLTQHPTFGYRRLWALLRYREGLRGESQSGLSDPQAQGVARSSTRLHAAAAGARVAEPGQPPAINAGPWT